MAIVQIAELAGRGTLDRKRVWMKKIMNRVKVVGELKMKSRCRNQN